LRHKAARQSIWRGYLHSRHDLHRGTIYMATWLGAPEQANSVFAPLRRACKLVAATCPTPKELEVQLTDRINRIQISPTAAVLAEAEKLKAKGIDVADFGPGEPDFPTPDHIKKAAIRAIQENKSKYTPAGGIAPLLEAIYA